MLGTVYIPPSDSPYSSGDEFDQIMSDIIDIGAKYNNCKICLVGDFNARTSNLPDFIEADKHLLHATGLDEGDTDIFIDRNMFEHLNIVVDRYTTDKVVDATGKKLLDFCSNTCMLIVNGRTGKKSSGGATCKGVSTIDYAIASPDLFKHINDFHIDIFDKCLSDVHSPIYLELNSLLCTDFPEPNTSQENVILQDTTQLNQRKRTTKTNWDPTKKNAFTEAINTPHIKHLTQQITNLGQNLALVSQSEINSLTETLEKMYEDAGVETGITKIYNQCNPVKKNNTTMQKNRKRPWFDNACLQKRKEFFMAKNAFKKSQTTENKLIMAEKSKTYRMAMREASKTYHRDLHNNLRNLKSNNPKEYWAIINKAEGRENNTGNITTESFMSHFKNLNDTEISLNATQQTQQSKTRSDDNLPFNNPISEEEVIRLTKKLKNGKASGIDNILNEFLKCSPPDMLKLISGFFNLILDTGIIPASWTIGLITPIYKRKGDTNDPDNYRGITLLSCLGKLFTMTINSRLNSYLEENQLLGEEQAGFREGYSTLDHIFSLHCIIELALSQKKRLYCAFIDYRKAFDTVNRSSLWLKLLKHDIKGKVFTVIQNLYNDAKSCIRYNGNLSEYFNCNIGVRQGENLSPLLFAIYLNDLECHLTEQNQGITYRDSEENEVLLKLCTLLYADDTILISETANDLQCMLNDLYMYCHEWELTVNTSKTNIVVFSKGKVRNLPTLLFGEEPIAAQHTYTYLGILFNYNGNFKNAMRKQISQAKRAMFSLLSKARKLQLPLDLQCHLFDTCVIPVLLYGCEVWGFSDLTEIERVQTFFCKYILKLGSQTANCIARGELGRQRLQCIIYQRMVNFWVGLTTDKPNKISHTLFQLVKAKYADGSLKSAWWANICKTLNECGLGNILNTHPSILNPNYTKAIVKDRMSAIENQEWHSEVMNSGHCTNYRIFKISLKFEIFLTTLNKKHATDLTRFRCGNHKLPIVVGRYTGIPKTERLCNLCDAKSLGDEFHYIFQCTAFKKERSTYINEKFLKHPNTLTMEILFTSEDPTNLSKLATFCSIIMASMREGRSHAKHKPKQKKRSKTCTMKEPSDLKINKNTSRRDRKSSATNKKCDKDILTGKALLNEKLSNRKTKNQRIKTTPT